MKDELYKLGYFILGDSAYTIEYILLPPYDLPPPRTSEDDTFFLFKGSHHYWMYLWLNILEVGNESLIIKESMRLNNFIVNYIETHKVRSEKSNEKSVFKEDVNSSGEYHMAVGNDVGCRGNISNNKRNVRYRGLKLGYSLKLLLADHDTHRPRN